MIKPPKIRKAYKKGGVTDGDPPDFSKLKKADPAPDGYQRYASPGATWAGTDSEGNNIYKAAPSTASSTGTPTTSTPATNTNSKTPTPTVPKIPTAAERNAQLKKDLEGLKSLSAQNVPKNVADSVTAIRNEVQVHQKLLDDAAKAKYGKGYTGTLAIGQQLSHAEGEKVLGKDGYAQFLDNIHTYESYRAKTMGTYDTQNVSWGKTDNPSEMYGTRMQNMFKNTKEQSAANTLKTPQNVLNYQKNPNVFLPPTANGKTVPTGYMIDGTNKVIPNVQIDPTTGKPIIDTKSKDVPQMNKGGKVKRKGYVFGSTVTPDISKLTPQQLDQYNSLSESDKAAYLNTLKTDIASGLTQQQKSTGIAGLANVAGDIGSNLIDSKVNVDMNSPNAKKKEMFKDAASTILKRAGQTTVIGANPFLVAATGGLSVPISAAVGLAEGSIEGAVKGKKKFNAYTQNAQMTGAENAASDQYSLAGGGKVKGPGTGTSDSVKAEVPAGSFIVPAKNAKSAEAIRKTYLNKKSGYAPKHDGDTAVKLSDGEHMFTPQEYQFLVSKGVDVNSLAPDAKKSGYGFQKGGSVGYADGTPVTGVEVTPKQEMDANVSALVEQYKNAETLQDVTKIQSQLKALGYNTDGTILTVDTSDNSQNTTPAIDPSTGKEYVPVESAAQKVFAGLGKEAGLAAILQTGIGVAAMAGKKPPIDTVDPQLLKQQQDALGDAKTGLSAAEMALEKNSIESNRRANVYNIANMSGGDAGLAIANSRSANLGANQSMLELAAKDAEVKATKTARADALTLSVADSKRKIFEDKQSMFDRNMNAYSNVVLSGINNFFGNLRYQDYLKKADERTKESQVNFSF